MVWRLDREQSGSGALGDIGAHVIDLARFLVDEIASVQGLLKPFVEERPGGRVTVDDAVESVVAFESGAVGRSRRHASAPAARTRSRGRSTARTARSRSTSSG